MTTLLAGRMSTWRLPRFSAFACREGVRARRWWAEKAQPLLQTSPLRLLAQRH